jgi:hypothetical protein
MLNSEGTISKKLGMLCTSVVPVILEANVRGET